MKLSERVDKIESALVRHLEESGTIRADLAWLKKAFWTLTAAVIAATVAHFITPGEYHDNQSLPKVQQVSRNN